MEEKSLSHFQSIPWCHSILSDPSIIITPTLSRDPKPSTEDSLFAETFKTSSTIPHCLSLYRIPSPSNPPSNPSPFIAEFTTLMTFGSGLNGGAHVLHGGAISALIDDVMGALLYLNIQKGNLEKGVVMVTANLEVKFLKRVSTPGTVAVSAWVEERKGRKFWLGARIVGEGGVEMARGKGLWVSLSEERLKL